jgi:hypothetical protein
MTNVPKLIPIDEALNEVVQSIGGNLVEDLLPKNKGRLPLNADFVFQYYNVIAELKRLVKDISEDPDHQEALQKMFDDFAREGLWTPAPSSTGRVKVQSRDLPEECAYRWINLVKPKIEQHVRKASKQIKSTKNLLNMPDAKGLLIAVHDGNYGLEPEAAINLISRCLKGKQHSHIDWVVYFCANMPAGVPNDGRNVRPFISAPRYQPSDFPKELTDKFYATWTEYEEQFYGMKIETVKAKELEDIDKIQFRKAPQK